MHPHDCSSKKCYKQDTVERAWEVLLKDIIVIVYLIASTTPGRWNKLPDWEAEPLPLSQYLLQWSQSILQPHMTPLYAKNLLWLPSAFRKGTKLFPVSCQPHTCPMSVHLPPLPVASLSSPLLPSCPLLSFPLFPVLLTNTNLSTESQTTISQTQPSPCCCSIVLMPITVRQQWLTQPSCSAHGIQWFSP